MTRKEHLEFCKHCDHQKFDPKSGILCSLKDDIADFEDDCENFSGDRSLIDLNRFVKKEKRQREPIKVSSLFIKKINSRSFDILSLFTPRQGYFFTPIIIALCIALFTIMVFAGSGLFYGYADDLLYWGANFRLKTMDGQLWRLVSNNFIHMGVIDLLINMYALFCIGVILEPIIGKLRFLLAFLMSAFMGSVVSIWWHDTSISAGTSAAIFGLYAMYLVLLSGKIIDRSNNKKILISTVLFVAFNLLYGVRNSIDGAAHIGGFISGTIIGFSYRFSISKPALSFRSLSINTLSLFIIISTSISLLSYISLDVIEYEEKMIEFTEIEEDALKIYKIARFSSEERCLKEIKEQGIPKWEKCRSIILDIKALEGLSPQLNNNVDLLLRYCNLRINSYTLMARSIEDKGVDYSYHQEVLGKKIELIIKEIQGFKANEDDDFYDCYDDDYGLNHKSSKPDLSKALYLVDGIIQDKDFDISNIDPTTIKAVEVLNGDAAIALYGKRGKEGVVMIRTK